MTDKTKKNWLKLLQKYRLLIITDNSFEEKFSLTVSGLNFFVFFVVFIFVCFFCSWILITNTSLHEYIPGRASSEVQRELISLSFKVDSLNKIVEKRGSHLNSILSVFEDENHIKKEKKNALYLSKNTKNPNNQTCFFAPVIGVVTDSFNKKTAHFGIDVVAKKGSFVCSVLDGTVVSNSWTMQNGYSVCIQHKNGFVSLYKHNSWLLKKVGDFVCAGESIAVIGNSGELSSGPHLHFELWYKSTPVNPLNFIVF